MNGSRLADAVAYATLVAALDQSVTLETATTRVVIHTGRDAATWTCLRCTAHDQDVPCMDWRAAAHIVSCGDGSDPVFVRHRGVTVTADGGDASCDRCTRIVRTRFCDRGDLVASSIMHVRWHAHGARVCAEPQCGNELGPDEHGHCDECADGA